MILGPRFLIEAGFIVAVAVVAGIADLSTWSIIGVGARRAAPEQGSGTCGARPEHFASAGRRDAGTGPHSRAAEAHRRATATSRTGVGTRAGA